ncbi:MAG: bifunctional phosphoribosyl-AMP cyclohydrolase/phosphoribosyl-ATP diphosphatase HisIE [Promethearchaeota archaeon]
MLLLKINVKDMDVLGGLTEFIDEVFVKRNWDLFLTLILKARKESLITLIKDGMLKKASKRVSLWISVKPNQKELKELLIKNGIKIFNLESTNSNEIINFDLTTDYSLIDNLLFKILDFEKSNGLIPTIVQDDNNSVLMLAYSSQKSLKHTIKTRNATYFSRSRNRVWIKGEESGNYQVIQRILYDCDADALLFRVKQKGFACHKGAYSCFHNEQFSIKYLYDLINDRIENSGITESYTKRLAVNKELLLSKIREESLELINYTDRENLIWEIADLTYFILVLMALKEISPDEIVNELWRRNKWK